MRRAPGRWLHRRHSGGADDWKVVSDASGQQYVISPSNQAPTVTVAEALAKKNTARKPPLPLPADTGIAGITGTPMTEAPVVSAPEAAAGGLAEAAGLEPRSTPAPIPSPAESDDEPRHFPPTPPKSPGSESE